MATHSSLLAWRIPWTEEPGGLQSMGSQIIGHDWGSSAPRHAEDLKNLPKVTPSFLLMCIAGVSLFHADSWTKSTLQNQSVWFLLLEGGASFVIVENRGEEDKRMKFVFHMRPMCTELSCWKYLKNAPFFFYRKSCGIMNLLLFLSFSRP